MGAISKNYVRILNLIRFVTRRISLLHRVIEVEQNLQCLSPEMLDVVLLCLCYHKLKTFGLGVKFVNDCHVRKIPHWYVDLDQDHPYDPKD